MALATGTGLVSEWNCVNYRRLPCRSGKKSEAVVAKFEPVLLARINKPDSTSLASYKADGGYARIKEVLSMAPGDVTNIVKDAGLRGRGGAGFPAG